MNDYLKCLKENLINEQELDNIINEMSFFIASNIKQVLNNVPIVDKPTMINQVEPGDILIAFTSEPDLKSSFTSALGAKVIATFQGSPYTSSKIVLNKRYIGGYGLTPANDVAKVPIKDAIKIRSEVCLIRLNTTSSVKKKAVSWINSKMGLTYESSDLLKAVWNRFTDGKLGTFFKGKTLDKNELQNLKSPLVCSTLISIAYYIAGYRSKFNNMNYYDVWPKDFLLDNNTKKICRIDYT